MPGGRAGAFLGGIAVGLALAASVAVAQAVAVLREGNYAIAPGQTATLYCNTREGTPRRNSEPLVQRNTATIGGVPLRVVMVSCFD